jgi:hypothetical protein
MSAPDSPILNISIVFGGLWYAICEPFEDGNVQSRSWTALFEEKRADKLLKIGNNLLERLNNSSDVRSLSGLRGFPGKIDLVLLRKESKPIRASKSSLTAYSTVALRDSLDRSPCGTGTASLLALFYKRGWIALSEELFHYGILGSSFSAKICDLKNDEIFPEISGMVQATSLQIICPKTSFPVSSVPPRIKHPFSFCDFEFRPRKVVRLVQHDDRSPLLKSSPSISFCCSEPRGGPHVLYLVLLCKTESYLSCQVFNVEKGLEVDKDQSEFSQLVRSFLNQLPSPYPLVKYGFLLSNLDSTYDEGYSLSDVFTGDLENQNPPPLR